MMSIFGESVPKNVQQTMALELFATRYSACHPDRKSGNRQNTLALAAGLLQTEDLGILKKLVVARPIVPVGKDHRLFAR
jgi:PhoH-like ATPase